MASLWLGGLFFVVMTMVAWRCDQAWLWMCVCVLLLLMLFVASRYVNRCHHQRIDALVDDIAMLRRVQINKDELLAVVSHELRTPINVVLGLHPIIREGLGHDEAALALLDRLHAATENLLQVFNTILDVSQQRAHGGGALHAAQQPAVTEDKEQATSQRRWRLLVVDDSPVNLLVVRLMLQKTFPHAQVEGVNSAREAMAYLDKTQPDVMLVDVLMPDMDGYTLTHWVRRHPRPILAKMPVVALTGQMRAEDAEQRAQCGINDVIYKPLDERQLSVRLCQLLEATYDEARA